MIGWAFKAGGCLGPNVYSEVPDGGWGWVVAVVFFIVELFTYGIVKIFGIFLQDFMINFDESNSRVSWIISICIFFMAFTVSSERQQYDVPDRHDHLSKMGVGWYFFVFEKDFDYLQYSKATINEAPLATVLSNRFGYQPVVMLGGFLMSFGTITSAFTNSANEMYITTGIIAGVGHCFAFLPTVTILSQYFHKRRSLVIAIASTGESVSIFAFAPAFTALKDKIGWRYCMVVIGILQASVIICGALLRPIVIKPKPTEVKASKGPSPKQLETTYMLQNELTRTSLSSEDSGVQSLSTSLHNIADGGEKRSAEKKALMRGTPTKSPVKQVVKEEVPPPPAKAKLLDFSVLGDCSFICYSLFGLFATLGFFAPQIYVIDLSVNRGVDRDKAAYMLSAMAAAEIFGRLSIGWVLVRKPIRKIYVLLICVLLLSVVLLVFTFVTEFWGLSTCCVLYGFLLGTVACTHIPMLAEDDVIGIERMTSAVGVYVFIQSFAGLAGPPLGGYLVDITKDYGSAFYSCAVGMALGTLFLGLVRPAKAGICCKKKSGQQQQRQESPNAQEKNSSLLKEAPEDFLEEDLPTETSPVKSQKSNESNSN